MRRHSDPEQTVQTQEHILAEKKRAAEKRRQANAPTAGKRALDEAKKQKSKALEIKQMTTAEQATLAAAMPNLNKRGRQSAERRKDRDTKALSTPTTESLFTKDLDTPELKKEYVRRTTREEIKEYPDELKELFGPDTPPQQLNKQPSEEATSPDKSPTLMRSDLPNENERNTQRRRSLSAALETKRRRRTTLLSNEKNSLPPGEEEQAQKCIPPQNTNIQTPERQSASGDEAPMVNNTPPQNALAKKQLTQKAPSPRTCQFRLSCKQWLLVSSLAITLISVGAASQMMGTLNMTQPILNILGSHPGITVCLTIAIIGLIAAAATGVSMACPPRTSGALGLHSGRKVEPTGNRDAKQQHS